MSAKKLMEFLGRPSEYIQPPKFTKDGNLLASLGFNIEYDDTVRLLSLTERSELICYGYSRDFYYGAVGFDPTGKLYAAGLYDEKQWAAGPYRFVVTDVTKKKVTACVKLLKKGSPLSSQRPNSVVFDQNCNFVAAIYRTVGPYHGGDIFIWQLSKGLLGFSLKEIGHMRGAISFLPLLAFTPEGKILVCHVRESV